MLELSPPQAVVDIADTVNPACSVTRDLPDLITNTHVVLHPTVGSDTAVTDTKGKSRKIFNNKYFAENLKMFILKWP